VVLRAGRRRPCQYCSGICPIRKAVWGNQSGRRQVNAVGALVDLASATGPQSTTYTAAARAWRGAPRSVAMCADQDQHFADRDQDLSYERDHGGLLRWPAAFPGPVSRGESAVPLAHDRNRTCGANGQRTLPVTTS
jgi:hypothetical protein